MHYLGEQPLSLSPLQFSKFKRRHNLTNNMYDAIYIRVCRGTESEGAAGAAGSEAACLHAHTNFQLKEATRVSALR